MLLLLEVIRECVGNVICVDMSGILMYVVEPRKKLNVQNVAEKNNGRWNNDWFTTNKEVYH